MKKLFFTFCCLMAMSVFCLNAFSQENAKTNPDPNACNTYVPIGSNKTITCSGSIGATSACPGTGWVCGLACCKCAGSGCGTYTYSWAPSTYLSCTNCQNPTVQPGCCDGGNPPSPITYTLTTSASGCGSNSATVQVTFNSCNTCCKIGNFSEEEMEDENIKIFPNPSSGKISVHFKVPNPNLSVKVYSVDGALILEKGIIANSPQLELDLSDKTKGNYFVQILDGHKGIVNKKILIQ